MKHFDSNVEYIKYLVNKEIASRFFKGILTEEEESFQEIAKAIIPGPKAQFRCCIYKERHIIEDRVRLALKPSKDDRVINVVVVSVINVKKFVQSTPLALLTIVLISTKKFVLNVEDVKKFVHSMLLVK